MSSPSSQAFSSRGASTLNNTTRSNIKPPPLPTFTKLSFAERKAAMSRPSTAHLVEGDRLLLRGLDRGAPGDPNADRIRRKSVSRTDMAKKRSTFFEDAFNYKDFNPIKERVRSEAVVMAEVKTNVIVSDEFTFITELSYHLSTRYQRPVSSIVVSLQHGACMLYGGTFEPAYIMTISALPAHVMPITNKRNSALIQKHMDEAIGVKADRGLLRFLPISEENLACNGKTMAAEIDEMENEKRGRGSPDQDDTRSIVSRRSKARKMLSVRSFTNFKAPSVISIPAPELTPPTSAGDEPDRNSIAPICQEEVPAVPDVTRKPAKRRKSFVATLFGRSGGRGDSRPPIPDLPQY